MKILVIDSDFISRKYLSELIEYQGNQAFVANNATEGLDIYLSTKIDIILCEIDLPKISGIELLSQVRKKSSKTIFILMSTNPDKAQMINCIKYGANDFVYKPIQDEEIERITRKYSYLNTLETSILEEDYGHLNSASFIYRFKTTHDASSKIVDRLVAEIGDKIGEVEKVNVQIGLSELITNAIEHGNLNITYQEKSQAMLDDTFYELFNTRLHDPLISSKMVEVEFYYDDKICRWTIKDEGNGFDRNSIPDPNKGDVANRLSGRGIHLSRILFDSIEYIGKGNVVVVSKKRNSGALIEL